MITMSAFDWFQAVWVTTCTLIIVSSFVWRFDRWLRRRLGDEPLPWDDHPLYGAGIERRHRRG